MRVDVRYVKEDLMTQMFMKTFFCAISAWTFTCVKLVSRDSPIQVENPPGRFVLRTQ